ncbi:MAG: hypothetical protein ABL940_04980 [Bacteroidia bacterium]
MKTLLTIFASIAICSATYAQKKNVIFYKDYTTFKGEEFNKTNAAKQKTGTWIKLKMDTLHKKVVLTTDDDKNITETDLNKYNWEVIGKGEYVKNMRQGKWIYGYNDLVVHFADVNYVNDVLVSPVVFYDEGMPWIKAEWLDNKWFYTLWDDDIKKYVDTHQKNTLEKLFLSKGIDFNDVK